MGYYEEILKILQENKSKELSSNNLMTLYYLSHREYPTTNNFYRALSKIRRREDITFKTFKNRYIYKFQDIK